MTIDALRVYFKTQLSDIYPEKEIESFFYLLAAHHLGLKRIDIALMREKKLPANEEKNFIKSLYRLQDQEPIQYIIGKTEFFGLPFTVSPSVLIPRPETEELVEWVLKSTSIKHPTIIDIGTGSGCIAIALAKQLPESKVYAVDISQEALTIAKNNALLNQVVVEFSKKDILSTQDLGYQYDIIVSNPPYVRELEKKEIAPNVLNNEPHQALFVKDDNALIFYKKIASLALQNLKSNGVVYFEINQYLGESTRMLLENMGFTQVELKKDMFGNDRMLKGVKK